jgi:outer membrane lipoprotein
MIDQMSWRFMVSFLLLMLVSACASSPVALDGDAVTTIGPAHVLEGRGAPGDRVIWGGEIVSVRNLADYTEISVVSYPLDGADRPRINAEPGVRFILHQDGFLEPVKYGPGRFVTAIGNIGGTRQVPVDEYVLTQPILKADRIHLWPADTTRWPGRTRFSIGVGIGL